MKIEMAVSVQETQTKWWHTELGSDIAVQGLSRAVYQKRFSWSKRNKLFIVVGSVAKNHGGGSSQIEKNVQHIGDAHFRSHRKKILTA